MDVSASADALAVESVAARAAMATAAKAAKAATANAATANAATANAAVIAVVEVGRNVGVAVLGVRLGRPVVRRKSRPL